MARRTCTLLLFVSLLCVCAAYKIDFENLMHGKNRPRPYKRFGGPFNQCTSPEKPFPCRDMEECIPLAWVCDDNFDCSDGYDEDPDVCTAAHRPVVENILKLLQQEESWMVPKLFGGKSIAKVAHALAVSSNVEDFADRLGLKDTKALKATLGAVNEDDKDTLVSLGMPKSSWNEVSFFFKQLIKSGFSS